MLSIVVIFGFFSWSFQYFKFFFRIPHILSVLGRLSLFETVDRAKCLFSWVVFFCCILGTWRCVCFFVIKKNRNVCFNFLPEPPNSFFSVCFKCTERFSLSDGWVSVFLDRLPLHYENLISWMVPVARNSYSCFVSVFTPDSGGYPTLSRLSGTLGVWDLSLFALGFGMHTNTRWRILCLADGASTSGVACICV